MRHRSVRSISYFLLLALLTFIIFTQNAAALDKNESNATTATTGTTTLENLGLTLNKLVAKTDAIIKSIFGASPEVTQTSDTIEIHDSKRTPVISDIKTYDETKQQKKTGKTSSLSVADIPDKGELEVDAIASKNVAVKFKVNMASKGEVILDDYGKNNPVSVPLPGRVVKYVEIGAHNISFSSANVTIRYSDSELNGGSEYDLTIYHWNGASWDALPTTVDMANKTLSATTTSLSPFGVSTSYTYYFENNATNQSVGADGNTSYYASGSTVTTPYKNLLKNGTMGATTTLIVTTPKSTTDIEAFRFYLPFNYSMDTNISANANYGLTMMGRNSGGPGDFVNISLFVYNFTTGGKTLIGTGSFAIGKTLTLYTGTISNLQYKVLKNSRLMVLLNLTTDNSGNAGTMQLQFNDTSSYITINETGTGGGVKLTNISALSSTTTAGTNATYTLNLTNNGTLSDTYTLLVTNTNRASTALLNISSPFTLAAGTSKIFALNVTNITANATAFHVNVTATAANSSQVGYINTTTTVTDITPPSVISNTNNVYVANNAFVSLNASITDTDTGVKNATVNVSQINSTINEAVLTLTGGYWINNSIIANKGDTNGLKNLTITAYDNAGNVNNSINMTVAIDATPPTQPANFTLISAGSASVNVNWSASTDPNNGSGIYQYQIERTNESFNYLTVPRNVMVNASSTNNIKATYENDSYWYAYKSNNPVDCTTCHGFSRPTNGNFFVKYNSSYLLVAMHVPDNDTSARDEKVRLAFDVSRDGGTLPNSDDIMYQIDEGNNLTFYKGNGSGWVNTSTTAISSVNGSGTQGPWFEIWIPLSEIGGSPGNNTLINFMFENECTNLSTAIRRDTYFPAGANENNPSTWMTVTFRNFTDYKFVQNVSSTSYNFDTILNLNGSYRYNFTVNAIDNVNNIGSRSAPLPIFTTDPPSYNISGYLLNTLNQGISGGQVREDDYIVSADSSGHYIFTGLSNATYNLAGSAAGYESNSTVSVTISGGDQNNVNITLTDDTPPSVISNTNNVIARNNTAPLLSAIITDLGTGVANATVNVSAISAINEAILNNVGGYWINNSITANKVTSGFVNLTITAYDNAGNVNHNVNMTVMIDPANGSTLTVDKISATTDAEVNATYTLNLTNAGIYNDNFTIAVSNPNNASYGLNITSPVNLASGASAIFTLNVTNASSGIFPVGVTAISINNPIRFSFINTTTTVNAPTYNHTITPVSPQVGSTVTDNVSSTSSSGITMTFDWIRDNGSHAITDNGLLRTNNYYIDSYGVDATGTWTINVTEFDNSNVIGTSSTTFTVLAAPEFGKLGAVLPLFAIGILYMSLRKKIKK